MSDIRRINLQIADYTYPMTIRTEREEELLRKAAKQINDKLNKYRTYFPKEDGERLMAMVAVDFAYQELCQEERNDTLPFKVKLKELTTELEEFFNKQ